jgi:hypothetical protein
MNTKVIREAFNDWIQQQEGYEPVSINEGEEMLCAGSSAPIEADGYLLYEAFKAGIAFAMTTR